MDHTVTDAPRPFTVLRCEARPLISVVVPSYNRAHWLGGALESLIGQQTDGEFDYEIIVVDNASHDNTREVVQCEARDSAVPVRYFYSAKPGDAPTRNRGAAEARGQWLAFFDDDQFADPRWLLELLHAAQQAGAHIVGGPVHLDLSPQQLRTLGRVGRAALREIDFYPALQTYRGKDLPGTGNALVSRHVFRAAGPFDESMTAGGSDTEFFRQARLAGYELWYTPRAVIRHRIEPNRMTAEYLRWDALSGGALHSCELDYIERGRAAMVFFALARAGQALMVSRPLMLWGWLRRDPGQMLGRRIQCWRAEGYVRAALRRLLPRLCPQQLFFQWLEFRNGRTIGAAEQPVQTSEAEAVA